MSSRSSSTRERSMMRARRLVSTTRLVQTPVSRNTGAIASWMMWPISPTCIFMDALSLELSIVYQPAPGAPRFGAGSGKIAGPLELLGGPHQGPRNALFHRAVTGVRHHIELRSGPGLVQAPGRYRRADHI